MLSMKWEPKSIFKLLCDKYVDIRNCFYCWDCCFGFQFQSIGFSSPTLFKLCPTPTPSPPSIPLAFYRLFHFKFFYRFAIFVFFHPIFTHAHAHAHRYIDRNRIFLFATMVKSIFSVQFGPEIPIDGNHAY